MGGRSGRKNTIPNLPKAPDVGSNIQMTTQRLLSLLLLLTVQNCYSQLNNTDTFFHRFKNDIEILQREHSGVVSMDDETKISYYSLISYSSIKDLIRFTNDSNPFIRSYVFAGLLRKQTSNKQLLKILDTHKNDTAKFISKGADVVTEWTVREFMQAGMNLKSANTLPKIDYKKEIERIRTQPELKLNITGISHGLIDKKELSNIDSLTLTNKELRIVSFTLFMAGHEMKSAGCAFTNEMKDTIQKSQSGEFLVFDNIKVMDKDKAVRQLVSLTLKLQ
jgi:hypothetical protein